MIHCMDSQVPVVVEPRGMFEEKKIRFMLLRASSVQTRCIERGEKWFGCSRSVGSVFSSMR